MECLLLHRPMDYSFGIAQHNQWARHRFWLAHTLLMLSARADGLYEQYSLKFLLLSFTWSVHYLHLKGLSLGVITTTAAGLGGIEAPNRALPDVAPASALELELELPVLSAEMECPNSV